MSAERAIAASAEQKTPRSQGLRQADRSDVRQELSPLETSPIRSRALPSGGRQPFMPYECLTTPAFVTYLFRSPIRGGCGRFPSDASEAPFIQQWFTMP